MIKFTNQVKAIIDNSENPVEMKEFITNYINHYIRAYKNIKNTGASDTILAYSFQCAVDEECEKGVLPDPRISCKEGCSYCCYQNTDITINEAMLLYVYSKELGIDIDWDHIRKQTKPRDTIPYEDRKCVFLKDNKCSVYMIRPIVCRKYFTISDPKNCNSKEFVNGNVLVAASNVSEIISNAMFEVSEYGDMPKMLLKVKEEMENAEKEK